VIKILCTTVGETASDYLSETMGWGLTNTTYVTGTTATSLVFLATILGVVTFLTITKRDATPAAEGDGPAEALPHRLVAGDAGEMA
jgi:uncharacterized membrane-anchored protein